MKSVCTSLKRTIAGAAAIAALAIAGPTLSSAEETAAGDTTAQEEAVNVVATDEIICEEIQRSLARTKKFEEEGVPEEFGSEEPFTFDPSKC